MLHEPVVRCCGGSQQGRYCTRVADLAESRNRLAPRRWLICLPYLHQPGHGFCVTAHSRAARCGRSYAEIGVVQCGTNTGASLRRIDAVKSEHGCRSRVDGV
jgi:hypothetical protein